MSIPLSPQDGVVAHMAASILLDYPTEERRSRFGVVAASVERLPHPLRNAFEAFLAKADALSQQDLEAHFTGTFDLKRKCCPYLTYYAAGDTRKRGMALVRFVEAYRAAGWEVAADELPDYLPMVLEFSALSESPIAQELLAAHRDGIEVLRTALETIESPYAHVVEAVSLSLPKIDDETRRRGRSNQCIRCIRGKQGGRAGMNTVDILLWVAFPYAASAVFILGHIYRYR